MNKPLQIGDRVRLRRFGAGTPASKSKFDIGSVRKAQGEFYFINFDVKQKSGDCLPFTREELARTSC